MPLLNVILDSTANLVRPAGKDDERLHVVPLRLMIGGETWTEPDVSPDLLFRMVSENKGFPKTSQPSPGEFREVAAPLAEIGDVLIITLSAALSGTAQSAAAGTRDLSRQRVQVFDSGTTAAGMVRMARTALALADQGLSLDETVAVLREVRKQTRTVFVPGTLEYLRHGGRIGGAAALLGSLLHIRPVLHLTGERVEVLDKVRTKAGAADRLMAESGRQGAPQAVDVVHIGAPDEGKALFDRVGARWPGAQISFSEGGAVLAAHLGPGLIGMIFQETGP